MNSSPPSSSRCWGPRAAAKAYPVPRSSLRLQMLQPFYRKRKQTVFSGSGTRNSTSGAQRGVLRKRELVFLEPRYGAESGRLRTHPVLRPETGEQERIRERPDSLEVAFQKQAVVGQIIKNGAAGPAREPRAVDYETCRKRVRRLSVNYQESSTGDRSSFRCFPLINAILFCDWSDTIQQQWAIRSWEHRPLAADL